MEGWGTYPIGNCAAHTGDHGNAASVSKANHLLGHSLCGHEHASHIDLEHGVAVLGRILQGRSLLLNTRRSNQTVHTALSVGDRLDHAVEQFRVTHIDATVVQLRAEFLGLLLNLCKLRGLL